MAKDPTISQQNVLQEPKPFRLVSKNIELFQIIDTIEVIDYLPTETPTSFTNQFKIYKSGATRRFYWYDTLNNEWVYVAGTV